MQRDGFKGRAQACKAKADKVIIHRISNDRPFGRQDQRALGKRAIAREKPGGRRDIQKGADVAEF
jgi:hypothetical protein